jgi:hypothetical protein
MSPEMESQPPSRVVLYTADDGKVTVDVVFARENFWLTQKAMAELFGVKAPAVNKHLKNIYATGELTPEGTISKMETVQAEGARRVARTKDYYNHRHELKRESAEFKAERIIQEELKRLRWNAGELGRRRKSDPGKLAIAARLRRETTLALPWIAARLQAGTWKSLNAKLHRWRKANESLEK